MASRSLPTAALTKPAENSRLVWRACQSHPAFVVESLLVSARTACLRGDVQTGQGKAAYVFCCEKTWVDGSTTNPFQLYISQVVTSVFIQLMSASFGPGQHVDVHFRQVILALRRHRGLIQVVRFKLDPADYTMPEPRRLFKLQNIAQASQCPFALVNGVTKLRRGDSHPRAVRTWRLLGVRRRCTDGDENHVFKNFFRPVHLPSL